MISFVSGEVEHLENLVVLFQHIKERGLTLNEEKCDFGKDSIEYYGHMLPGKGLEPSTKKIQAIGEMGPPHNVSDDKLLWATFH